MSALLYHGVGVGKTCAAIQTAEAYLDVYPRRKVMIVAPPTIQAGFYRTIFDIENLRIGVGEALNSAVGCTGDTYLRITGLINERSKDIIEKITSEFQLQHPDHPWLKQMFAILN
jgi:hypothetical protein